MANKFASIDKKKSAPAPSKKALKEEKVAQTLNSLPTPDTQDLSRNNEKETTKPEKGMKFKKVL
jgi:hypothetical protein